MFSQKFPITRKHLTPKTKRRPGVLISPKVRFIVAHDTGNPGSTASGNAAYYARTCDQDYASAHIFVDDKEIVECIPSIGEEKAEKAWHVRYKMPQDNKLYGCDANDAAIGVEFCFGGKIDGAKSYEKYVWTLAYLCSIYGLDPAKDITGHFLLDPGRKSDPENGLRKIGRSYKGLLADVKKEYDECLECD